MNNINTKMNSIYMFSILLNKIMIKIINFKMNETGYINYELVIN